MLHEDGHDSFSDLDLVGEEREREEGKEERDGKLETRERRDELNDSISL